MSENEQKLLRRMILGRALNSIQESNQAILNTGLKDELPCGMTDIIREIREISSYISNYEKYKPYLPIIEEHIQKRTNKKEEVIK